MLPRRDLIRQLAAVSAGAIAVPALFVPQPVPAAGNVLHVANVPIEPTADLFYTDEQGYFKSAGLNVDIQVLANGQNFVGGVTAGTSTSRHPRSRQSRLLASAGLRSSWWRRKQSAPPRRRPTS